MKSLKLTALLLAVIIAATSLFCATAVTLNDENAQKASEAKAASVAQAEPQAEEKAEAKTAAEVKTEEKTEAKTEAKTEKKTEAETEQKTEPQKAEASEKKASVKLSAKKAAAEKKSKLAVADENAETVVYSYVVKCEELIAAFEGSVTYPSTLTPGNISLPAGTSSNIKDGKILFNGTKAQEKYDCSNGLALITVTFAVNGEYNQSDVVTTLTDFYTVEKVTGGNVTYRYSNLFDGVKVSGGTRHIDNPSEDTQETKRTYTINYTYGDAISTETVTKTVTTFEDDTDEVAQANMPYFNNPHYDYNYNSQTTTVDGDVINVTLKQTPTDYDVTLDGSKVGTYHYLDEVTVNSPSGNDTCFIVDGKNMYYGKSFTFFVVKNTTIETDEDEVVENAVTITKGAITVNEKKLTMEMFACAKADGFERMGVAFASGTLSKNNIKTAAAAITSGTDQHQNTKVVIHNADTPKPNKSGLHQFVYAPYININDSNKNLTLYFAAFAVTDTGEVVVSDKAVEVKFADVFK